MINSPTARRPDFVPPPGNTLAELLEERGMTQAQLADQMGRPRKTLNEIINGKAAIVSQTALELERVLGLPAEFWMRREADYRAFRARDEERTRLAESLACLKDLPVRAMVRAGWLANTTDRIEMMRRCLDFFRVVHPDQLANPALSGGVAFRKAERWRSEPIALAAWLRRGESLAEQAVADLPPFDESSFRSALGKIRAATRLPLADATRVLRAECERAGALVLFVPELPKTHVSGATRWIANHPVIQLSMRYKRDDQFWFTYFHEAGHVLCHGRREIYVDEDHGASTANAAVEEEANDFASKTLIPGDRLNEFVRAHEPISKAAIRAFATRIGIAPGIVVGQLQHRGFLPRSHCNDLKVEVDEKIVTGAAL